MVRTIYISVEMKQKRTEGRQSERERDSYNTNRNIYSVVLCLVQINTQSTFTFGAIVVYTVSKSV